MSGQKPTEEVSKLIQNRVMPFIYSTKPHCCGFFCARIGRAACRIHLLAQDMD